MEVVALMFAYMISISRMVLCAFLGVGVLARGAHPPATGVGVRSLDLAFNDGRLHQLTGEASGAEVVPELWHRVSDDDTVSLGRSPRVLPPPDLLRMASGAGWMHRLLHIGNQWWRCG